ncbi:MAG TPA: GtrA family protein [Lachnospiraceae bacterium]|nr:GtrA family protein [Lachnospiraceae bacterium]
MDKFWELVESVLHFVIYKILHLKLSEEVWGKICQFVKFGVVGVSNTLISYAVYAVLVNLNWHYLLANVAGFVVSVINAYYWSDRYVFKAQEGEERVWWKAFLKTFISYAGTGLILNNILLVIWVDVAGIHEMLGPVINLFVTVPLNFLLNKYWAYRDKA